jgi:hypothetical protein
MEETIKDYKDIKIDILRFNIGDSLIVTKSFFDKESINYNEFCVNLRAASLKCDVRREEVDNWNYRLVFVEKCFEGVSCIFDLPKEIVPVKDVFDMAIKDNQLGSGINTENGHFVPNMPFKKSAILSLKKGDTVVTKGGFVGIITKYPSNKEIELTEGFSDDGINYHTNSSSNKLIVNKDDINEKKN